jgi:hypothetical protein
MPKLDGTGPKGTGPMTGHGKGSCMIPINNVKEEMVYLKNRQQALQRELKQIKSRITKIEKQSN